MPHSAPHVPVFVLPSNTTQERARTVHVWSPHRLAAFLQNAACHLKQVECWERGGMVVSGDCGELASCSQSLNSNGQGLAWHRACAQAGNNMGWHTCSVSLWQTCGQYMVILRSSVERFSRVLGGRACLLKIRCYIKGSVALAHAKTHAHR